MEKVKNPNHELDLNLIEEFGPLHNHEVSLADKNFLTPEKAKFFAGLASSLLKKSGIPQLEQSVEK